MSEHEELEGLRLQNKIIADELNSLKRQAEDSAAKYFILASEITNMNDKVDSAIKLLYNDTRTGRKGLVQSLDDLVISFKTTTEAIQKSVSEINIREDKKEAVKKGQMAIYGVIGAGAVWLLGVLLKAIFPALIKFI